MVNSGGWLLLSIFFSGLLLLVQRAERKRRVLTFVIMVLTGSIVWRYGLYRISMGCSEIAQVMCYFVTVRQRAEVLAHNTVSASLVTAIIFNFLFWFAVGRYNPPGSSDSITVIGRNDLPAV